MGSDSESNYKLGILEAFVFSAIHPFLYNSIIIITAQEYTIISG